MIDLTRHPCAEVLERLAGLGFHRVADPTSALRPGAYRVTGHSESRIGFLVQGGHARIVVHAHSIGTDLPELAVARLVMLADMATADLPFLGLFAYHDARRYIERHMQRHPDDAAHLLGSRIARIAPVEALGLELAALAGHQPLTSNI